jgi:hypothetical protein
MQRTESGRQIPGLVFIKQPWIFWNEDDRRAHCERCGDVTEIPDQQTDPNKPTKALAAFWATHKDCTPGGDPPKPKPPRRKRSPRSREASVSKPVKPDPPREKRDTPSALVVTFPQGNGMHFSEITVSESNNQTMREDKFNIPHGIPFKLVSVDPLGAWFLNEETQTTIRLWWSV